MNDDLLPNDDLADIDPLDDEVVAKPIIPVDADDEETESLDALADEEEEEIDVEEDEF